MSPVLSRQENLHAVLQEYHRRHLLQFRLINHLLFQVWFQQGSQLKTHLVNQLSSLPLHRARSQPVYHQLPPLPNRQSSRLGNLPRILRVVHQEDQQKSHRVHHLVYPLVVRRRVYLAVNQLESPLCVRLGSQAFGRRLSRLGNQHCAQRVSLVQDPLNCLRVGRLLVPLENLLVCLRLFQQDSHHKFLLAFPVVFLLVCQHLHLLMTQKT